MEIELGLPLESFTETSFFWEERVELGWSGAYKRRTLLPVATQWTQQESQTV